VRDDDRCGKKMTAFAGMTETPEFFSIIALITRSHNREIMQLMIIEHSHRHSREGGNLHLHSRLFVL
jgi:hypothetical protein